MPELYLGVVYDAMRALGFKDESFYIDIKPQAGYRALIQGPAFTTFGRLVEPSEHYSSLDNIRLTMYKRELFKHKPVVLLSANDEKVAHSGDITSKVYQSLGAVGFITDGNVRDIERIDKMNFPCFCKGVNPIDALDYWALVDFNVEIVLAGVKVSPGDHIFASRDGVIVVPMATLKKFKQEVANILDKENRARHCIETLPSDDYETILSEFVQTHGRW